MSRDADVQNLNGLETGYESTKSFVNPTSVEALGPYQKLPEIACPQICVWSFMSKAELTAFLQIESKAKIREAIENKLSSSSSINQSSAAKTVSIELLYSVAKFCKSSQFSLDQTGVVLSIFLLTHKFFASNLYTSAEKVYNYFKELILRHSVSAPPDNLKVFCYQDSKKVLNFFCTIYLRNLPLVRLLILPNYGFYLDHKLEPEYDFAEKKTTSSGKDKKGKKDKNGKKDKKDKTGKKDKKKQGKK